MTSGVRFRVLALVGEGGFGRVYRARLETSDGFSKDVAVKILTDESPVPGLLKRFRDEARLLGLLRDRAIVKADPPSRIGGRWSVVMEFVDGVSLGALVDTVPVPPGVALEIIGEVARALGHAWHQEGPEGQPLHLLHRDIKPDNIQITPAGEMRILDFGIARADFQGREYQTRHALGGTPGYIAPERLHGIELPAGDVYSLGVVLHEAVTRVRPRLQPAFVDDSGQARVVVPRLEVPDLHWADPHAMAVLELAARMRLEDPTLRPTPREVEDFCRQLRNTLPAPWLRDWAETHVPHRHELPPDGLVGQVLAQTTEPGAYERAPVTDDALLHSTKAPLARVSRGTGGVALGAMLGTGLTLVLFAGFVSAGLGAAGVYLWRADEAPGAPDPEATNERPETPASLPSPLPAPAEVDVETPTPRSPKIIVIGDSEGIPPSRPISGADIASDPNFVHAPVMGRISIRTVPTGAKVFEGGRELVGVSGTFKLEPGKHLLKIVSTSGEAYEVPVMLTADQETSLCYDFDNNLGCAP